MSFILRPYQEDATSVAVNHMINSRKPGLCVLPTGSGKSLVIANICQRMPGEGLVFQPSKEILHQNYQKFVSYDPYASAGIFSASAGQKRVRKVTFATIGSVRNASSAFKHFKYIIIDECHGVNPEGGMYADFLKLMGNVPVIGLTATPYRLHSSLEGTQLKFITRTRPKVFDSMIHCTQVGDLRDQGFLAALKYYEIQGFDTAKVKVNSSGADFDDRSLKKHFNDIGFSNNVLGIVARQLKAGRKHILVFTKFVEEAEAIAAQLQGAACVSADTPGPVRDKILNDFRGGRIKVVVNVGVLTTGFDFPALDAVVIARPTKSLALWYQMVGRALRPFPGKEDAWIIDMCQNFQRFGKVEDLRIENTHGLPAVFNKSKQLTNILFDAPPAWVQKKYAYKLY